MRTAREVGHEHAGCNGRNCLPTHDHTTACDHNRYCDRLTSAIEARDTEHAEALSTMGFAVDVAQENYNRVSRDLATARSALEQTQAALWIAREALKYLETHGDSAGDPAIRAEEALDDMNDPAAIGRALAALTPATGEPT